MASEANCDDELLAHLYVAQWLTEGAQSRKWLIGIDISRTVSASGVERHPIKGPEWAQVFLSITNDVD